MRATVPERGFTLLEALTAGAVFLLAVTAVSLLTIQGSNNASKGMRYAQASRVATQEMEKFAVRGWGDLGNLVDGGVQPFVVPGYTITEQPDGGGRRYDVAVTITDTSGPPGASVNGFPSPNIGTASLWVPSYFVQVQVTSLIPNSDAGVVVSQATYVSPSP
jgi:hypothetical protein